MRDSLHLSMSQCLVWFHTSAPCPTQTKDPEGAHLHPLPRITSCLGDVLMLLCCCCPAPGVVPSVPAANHSEPLLPWGPYHQGRVVLGSTVEAACAAPADLNHAAALFKNEKFILCYRQDKKKVRRSCIDHPQQQL